MANNYKNDIYTQWPGRGETTGNGRSSMQAWERNNTKYYLKIKNILSKNL